jgi:hypothetical protein
MTKVVSSLLILVCACAYSGAVSQAVAQVPAFCSTAQQHTKLTRKLTCEFGFWHRIGAKDWTCPNGTVAKEVIVSDRNTGKLCWPINFCTINDAKAVVSAQRVCRGGLWHIILTETWICPGGAILTSVEMSDRATKKRCTPPAG